MLLAPAPRLLYSGMMPGWLAGQYPFEACTIDLRRVAVAGIAGRNPEHTAFIIDVARDSGYFIQAFDEIV